MQAPSVFASAHALLLGCLGCFGVPSCTAAGSVTSRGTPAPPSSGPTVPPAARVTDLDLDFTPIHPVAAEPLPVVKIVEPAENASTSLERAASLQVRFTTSDARSDVAYSILFDGNREAVTDARSPIPLADLFDEARGATPGTHVIAVVACSRDGTALRDARGQAAVAVRTFRIGDVANGSSNVGGPMVLHLLPRGTLNGPEARDSAVLDFVVLGAPEAFPRVVVSHASGTSRRLLDGRPPYSIRGLSGGDYQFEIELLSRASVVFGTSGRHWITVNPEPLPQ